MQGHLREQANEINSTRRRSRGEWLSVSFTLLTFVAIPPRAAHAILVTSSAGIPADAPTIDFLPFVSVGRIVFNTGDVPLEIDSLSTETVLLRPISGTSTTALILGNHTPPAHPDNSFYLGTNGHWGPGRSGFLGIGGGNGSMVTSRIEFTTSPISTIGGLFNYSPDFTPITMSALDQNLVILEQYTVNLTSPISTPSQIDTGEFRGIMRNQNDIFAIQFTAPFAVIDDIRFVRAVPEPIALLLIATAAIALSPTRRRKSVPHNRV